MNKASTRGTGTGTRVGPRRPHRLATEGRQVMGAAKATRLTDGQRRVLLLARDGRPLDSGVYGMSAYGGLATILSSCRHRGWLDGNDAITPAGRAALASTEGR